MSYHVRPCTLDDVPQLERLIPLSVYGLQAKHYSTDQMAGALGTVFGVDTQLIRDGTYFVAEADSRIVGCGGWSRRKTLYGGDRGKSGPDPELDPAVDAARIRAFFVHPDWARRGIGSEIMRCSEQAAIAAGFRRIEIVATLPGEPLYARFGYEVAERFEVALANGHSMPVVQMTRSVRDEEIPPGFTAKTSDQPAKEVPAVRQVIGAVTIVVREYDEAISYYTDVLGFSLVEDRDLGGGKRWVLVAPPGTSGCRLLLAKAKNAQELSAVGRQAGGRVFLFLYTDDFWRDHRAMSERGVLFCEQPRVEDYGVVAVFVDIYGNRWDLLQLTAK